MSPNVYSTSFAEFVTFESIDNNRHRCYIALTFSRPRTQDYHCVKRILYSLVRKRVSAWPYLAEGWPAQLAIDFFTLHQVFAVCCPYTLV